jgi:hypothetical protein
MILCSHRESVDGGELADDEQTLHQQTVNNVTKQKVASKHGITQVKPETNAEIESNIDAPKQSQKKNGHTQSRKLVGRSKKHQEMTEDLDDSNDGDQEGSEQLRTRRNADKKSTDAEKQKQKKQGETGIENVKPNASQNHNVREKIQATSNMFALLSVDD